MCPTHAMRATVSRAPTINVPPSNSGHSMQQQQLKIVAPPGNPSGTVWLWKKHPLPKNALSSSIPTEAAAAVAVTTASGTNPFSGLCTDVCLKTL